MFKTIKWTPDHDAVTVGCIYVWAFWQTPHLVSIEEGYVKMEQSQQESFLTVSQYS